MLPSGMFPSIISFYFLSFCFFWPFIPFTTVYVSICFLHFFFLSYEQMACLTWFEKSSSFSHYFRSLRDQHICNTYIYIIVRVTLLLLSSHLKIRRTVIQIAQFKRYFNIIYIYIYIVIFIVIDMRWWCCRKPPYPKRSYPF